MNKMLRFASVSVLALAAAGCITPAPTPLDMSVDVPAKFDNSPADDAQAVPASGDWWTSFGDTELPQLETTALANNLDIAAAAARVTQAYASAGVSFSPLLPSVSASGGGTRSGNEGTGTASNSFTFGGSASYELDFWGKNISRYLASSNSADASRYAQATTVRMTVTSSVANAYFSILAFRERIKLTQQNIDAAKQILAITQAKVDNGVSSNLDLAQQQATVASQLARLPALQESEREARHTLAILLGRPPQNFDIKDVPLDSVKVPHASAGVPSDVLTRRPDIAQAEANLKAAHASLDAARAAFLPSVTLSASGTFSKATLADLIDPANLAWRMGASIAQSIFDGGTLNYQRQSAKARQDELIASYRLAVFNAFNDVDNALGQANSNEAQLGAQTEQVRAASEAFRISTLRYKEGVADVLSVLQTQQTLFSAQDSLIQTKLARLQSSVSVYRAAGGGWAKDTADDADVPESPGWLPL